jgi:hypothetical protein
MFLYLNEENSVEITYAGGWNDFNIRMIHSGTNIEVDYDQLLEAFDLWISHISESGGETDDIERFIIEFEASVRIQKWFRKRHLMKILREYNDWNAYHNPIAVTA